jgi:tRNA uridine 5-carboxymethylaminomethyl modification enzyme
MKNNFDVIVIGGGHAGIEASVVASKMGMKTALLSMELKAVGRPSCNPSIGGSAKGHLVKEIDALGGVMGLLADKAGLHFKMLNKSKGPAIWSPRAQIDKDLYSKYALQLLLNTENLTLINGTAVEILIEKHHIKGIVTNNNEILYAKAVILCAGTFLNGLLFTGKDITKGGRIGEKSAEKISEILESYGLKKGRLKTGTPPRVSSESLDYRMLQIEHGDDYPESFSYKTSFVKNTLVCYGTDTSESTHDILRTGFKDSPLFTGMIHGTGPRYCPSIEDKINRFSDKLSHKILLEPEGLNTNSVYVNGFSTSLPKDIQVKGVRSIPGLEKAEFMRYGYAVEYDFFFPFQLKFTFETKAVSGLYFAGQINGTSGYEEAASQGLIAGINAALNIQDKPPFILRRNEAYIGVMIDDLVNKNTEEPYRIFTSLAEYRLILRQDNADQRLMKYGNQFGLISDYDFNKSNEHINLINDSFNLLKNIKLKPDVVNSYFQNVNESNIDSTTDIYNLCKRSNAKLNLLLELSDTEDNTILSLLKNRKAIEQLQISIKYEGYISRQNRDIQYFLDNENKIIPEKFDYFKLTSLSKEGREKLIKIKPASLGQASRIAGVSAADISIISLYLK